MGRVYGRKLASLLAGFILLIAVITGCSTAGGRQPIVPNDEEQTVSTSDEFGPSHGQDGSGDTDDESFHVSDSETTSDNKGVAGDDIESETTIKNSDGTEGKTTTKKPGGTEGQTTTKKPGGTEGQTTTKKPGGTEGQTTTKKPSSTEGQTTTKKPSSTEGQTTTKQPDTSESQTTTKKPASSSTADTAEEMAKEIVDDIITSSMTDFQKAITIHDWLVFNLDYDFTYSYYHVKDALQYRTCVCQGYAESFEMMCEMAGLEATFVGGTATNSAGLTESHGWNQVKIDGKWYNVDVTWDDPAGPGKDPADHSGNRYDYFLISDSQMYKDHKATFGEINVSSQSYDTKTILKYGVSGGMHQGVAFVENAADVSAAVEKAVKANKSEITLWYYDASLTAANMWEPLSKLVDNTLVYPAKCTSAIIPTGGIIKYMCEIIPMNQWSSIPVATTAQEAAAIINKTFDGGATTMVLRCEGKDGLMSVPACKYNYTYYRRYYNNGLYYYMEITKK